MKKIFTLLTLAGLLFAGTALSQSRLSFGLAGSFLTSGITNQNNYGLPFEMDYAITLGGAGNLHMEYDFNKHLGLVLQVGYTNLGQNYTDVYMDTNYIRRIQLNYLTIPLMFKFRTGGEVARFFVMAGPQISYLLSATQVYYKQDLAYNKEAWNDITKHWVKIGSSTITDRYNSIDVSARIDLGVEISIIKNLWINGGITMGYGFLDINASDWRIPDNSSNTYNPSHNLFGGFNVGINYCFQP